jgi:predicted SAM-dependent methyltransferase
MAELVKTLLHIGCGFQGIEALPPLDWSGDWRQVRVDIDPEVEPDVVASMTHMPMVESDSVDIVFSKHNLEHLEAHEVPLALGEFHRVLKSTGFLICRCPDLGAAIELLARKDLEETLWVSTYDDGTKVEVALIDMIFGARAEIERGKGFMRHRTGFTDASLTRHLERAGFEGVSVSRNTPRMELLCNARKVERDNLFTNLNAELNAAAQKRA